MRAVRTPHTMNYGVHFDEEKEKHLLGDLLCDDDSFLVGTPPERRQSPPPRDETAFRGTVARLR